MFCARISDGVPSKHIPTTTRYLPTYQTRIRTHARHHHMAYMLVLLLCILLTYPRQTQARRGLAGTQAGTSPNDDDDCWSRFVTPAFPACARCHSSVYCAFVAAHFFFGGGGGRK